MLIIDARRRAKKEYTIKLNKITIYKLFTTA